LGDTGIPIGFASSAKLTNNRHDDDDDDNRHEFTLTVGYTDADSWSMADS
jgi:hypothetical protein